MLHVAMVGDAAPTRHRRGTDAAPCCRARRCGTAPCPCRAPPPPRAPSRRRETLEPPARPRTPPRRAARAPAPHSHLRRAAAVSHLDCMAGAARTLSSGGLKPLRLLVLPSNYSAACAGVGADYGHSVRVAWWTLHACAAARCNAPLQRTSYTARCSVATHSVYRTLPCCVTCVA